MITIQGSLLPEATFEHAKGQGCWITIALASTVILYPLILFGWAESSRAAFKYLSMRIQTKETCALCMMRVQTTVYKDEPKERRGSWVHLLISCPSNSLATLTFRQSQCHVYPLYLTEEHNGFHCIFKDHLERKRACENQNLAWEFWGPFKVIADHINCFEFCRLGQTPAFRNVF